MALTSKISKNATDRWFRQTSEEIQTEYGRLHDAARSDPQYAGHEAESGWKSILEKWLPPEYEVGSRKYILPDISSSSEHNECFETDLVIFNPTYPKPLREKAEVLSGGIVAAFFVRLTADADGIRDASRRASILKRATTVRMNTPRLHLQGPFSVGLLAHSHNWKADKSTPFENVTRNLNKFNLEYAKIPREVLDYTCIADLGIWSTSFWLRVGRDMPMTGLTPEQIINGSVSVSTGCINAGMPEPAVARFIVQLIYRLSFIDPTLRHWALGLLAALPTGGTTPEWRHWNILEVLPQRIVDEIKQRGFDNIGGGNHDWSSVFA